MPSGVPIDLAIRSSLKRLVATRSLKLWKSASKPIAFATPVIQTSRWFRPRPMLNEPLPINIRFTHTNLNAIVLAVRDTEVDVIIAGHSVTLTNEQYRVAERMGAKYDKV